MRSPASLAPSAPASLAPAAQHLECFAYRPDLDGLRAIAIILVMLEHLFSGFGLFRGGLGVDVFFVLSGYLITTIVHKELNNGTFRFRDFYARRIRRLFPTLIVALTACLVTGWFILNQNDFRLLGGTVAASATSSMNYVLFSGMSFFHVDPKTLPFGHLWSLALEEQFYLIFPWILVGMTRAPLLRQWRVPVLVALSALSGLYWYEHRDLWGQTYYDPRARSWELMMGVMLALCWGHVDVWKQRLGVCAHIFWKSPWGLRPVLLGIGSMILAGEMSCDGLVLAVGASLIGLAQWLKYGGKNGKNTAEQSGSIPSFLTHSLESESQSQNWKSNQVASALGVYLILTALMMPLRNPLCLVAILATVGTALLIASGPNAWTNIRCLSRPGMIYMGKISYALYVVHYPLYVIWGFVSGEIVRDSGVLWLIFALCFPLAGAIYHFVEKPTRRGPYLWRWVMAMAICAGVGYAGYAEKIRPMGCSAS